MAKKKILVDIFYLHLAQTGIKTYIECLCEEIVKTDSAEFDFIVTPDPNSISRSAFFKGKTALWKNLLYQALYFFRKFAVLPWLSYKHQAAIVFSPDIVSPIWAKGIKVSVIHDAFFWESPQHYNALWLKVYLKLLDFGIRDKAHVVTISEHSKKQIQKYLKRPSLPIHVVYPSSHIRFKERNQYTHAHISGPYFLHVGVMEKRKNLLTLIEAFAGFIQREGFQFYKLVLVGQRGPRETLDDYENILTLIQKLHLGGKVILPGHVSQQQLDNYYHHATGYVFPSLNEGFGMPILEAFSYGLPVIIAKQGTLMEVGRDAVLTVQENNAVGFGEALFKIASDEDLRSRLAEQGRERLKKFSSANFFLSLTDCFRKILNE